MSSYLAIESAHSRCSTSIQGGDCTIRDIIRHQALEALCQRARITREFRVDGPRVQRGRYYAFGAVTASELVRKEDVSLENKNEQRESRGNSIYPHKFALVV